MNPPRWKHSWEGYRSKMGSFLYGWDAGTWNSYTFSMFWKAALTIHLTKSSHQDPFSYTYYVYHISKKTMDAVCMSISLAQPFFSATFAFFGTRLLCETLCTCCLAVARVLRSFLAMSPIKHTRLHEADNTRLPRFAKCLDLGNLMISMISIHGQSGWSHFI